MDNKCTERTPHKYFRFESEDHLIAKLPNSSKDNEKRRNQERFSERGNCAPQKECNNGKNNNDQKICTTSMACMSDNDECFSRNFCDISQWTNFVLDSGVACHMAPQISNFIPGSLEYTDKHIEFADGNHVTDKQKRQVRIRLCKDNGDTFIATLHNVILAPDICDILSSIITSMNLRHNFLFHKGFCAV